MLKVSHNLTISYIAVFFAAALLYVATCAPEVVWQDSGLIQYRVWHSDIEGRLGLALSHPLFYILAITAKKIPLGEFGYRINVLTAVISAVAVANLFLLLRLWLGKNFPALIGAATMALSHTFWRHATIPETYNLVVALLLFELIMLLLYAKTSRVHYLYLLGLINGLAIANHMLASIAFICYLVLAVVLVVSRQIKRRDFTAMALLWIFGALPYEYLIVKNILHSGDMWGTLASAAFGIRWQGAVLNTTLNSQIIKENLMYVILNFPTPNILLGFVGLWALYKVSPKRWFGNVLLALLILFFLFAFRYTVPDRYAFFLPFYCVFSILIGVGASMLIGHKISKAMAYVVAALCLLPVPAYIMAPKMAKQMGVTIGRGREIPYRDDYVYFLQPWRTGYRGAERFANEVLDSVEPAAIIFADATTAPPLLYTQQVKAKRPDVKIISSVGSSEDSPEFNEQTIEKLLAERAIYVVSPIDEYCPAFLLERYKFQQAGLIWKVVESKKPKSY